MLPTEITQARNIIRKDKELWDLTTSLLAMTGSTYRKAGYYIRIDPKQAIITVWNPARYKRLQEADISRVLEDDPPHVVAYETVFGVKVYVPSDGNHRIAVAEDKGMKRVKVYVSSIIPLSSPTTLVYHNGVLWVPRGRGELQATILRIPPERVEFAREILSWRGVELVDYRKYWLMSRRRFNLQQW